VIGDASAVGTDPVKKFWFKNLKKQRRRVRVHARERAVTTDAIKEGAFDWLTVCRERGR
jgi:hypothetical protein